MRSFFEHIFDDPFTNMGHRIEFGRRVNMVRGRDSLKARLPHLLNEKLNYKSM